MSRKFTPQYTDKHSQGCVQVVRDPVRGCVFAYGPTPPSGVKGFAPNCIFIDTDAASPNGILYNSGTLASCTFTALP